MYTPADAKMEGMMTTWSLEAADFSLFLQCSFHGCFLLRLFELVIDDLPGDRIFIPSLLRQGIIEVIAFRVPMVLSIDVQLGFCLAFLLPLARLWRMLYASWPYLLRCEGDLALNPGVYR